jgi:outer membrane protein assembly factor BamD (BamD/ComL family)
MTQIVRMQVARPPHFAEREEIDAALKAETAEALLLFIDRHPHSRYRAEAEAALRQLGLTPPTR